MLCGTSQGRDSFRIAVDQQPFQRPFTRKEDFPHLQSRKRCGAAGNFRYRDEEQLVRVERILATLKTCTGSRNLQKGKLIHSEATETGDIEDMYVANSVINMYARCGSLPEAHEVFDKMRSHSTASWTALISGYAENGKPALALQVFQQMVSTSSQCCRPDPRTFVAAIQACARLAEQEQGALVDGMKLVKMEALQKGMAVHREAARSGLETDIFVGNTLVNMYGKCGCVTDARRCFDRLKNHNVVSWTSLLMGLADNGDGQEVLSLFSQMQTSCEANARTYVAALKACTNLAAEEEGKKQAADGRVYRLTSLEKGMFVHSQAVKLGLDCNVYLGSTAIDMYARCGSLIDARGTFDRMQKRDVVCWNVLMLRYAENGDGNSALELYERLLEPDSLSCVAALKACAILAAKEEGKEIDGKLVKLVSLEKGMGIHAQAEKLGFGGDLMVANSTVDMYGKCGSTDDARRVFEAMVYCRTLVTWNALILGYAENAQGEFGLELFQELIDCGEAKVAADGRTYAAALKSCASSSHLGAAKQIHSRICSRGIESDPVLLTCLLDAYGKCGSLVDAQIVFDSAPARVLEAWTALMDGFSGRGEVDRVLEIFGMMLEEDLQPDGVTFVCILTVCSHAGLVDKARKFFAMMNSKFGIWPWKEHYHCMVDALGRANELDEAVEIVKRMPFGKNAVTWMTVLGACVKWKNVVVGRIAFEELLRIDDKDCGGYMLMAALYRSAGMWEEQTLVEGMLKKQVKLRMLTKV